MKLLSTDQTAQVSGGLETGGYTFSLAVGYAFLSGSVAFTLGSEDFVFWALIGGTYVVLRMGAKILDDQFLTQPSNQFKQKSKSLSYELKP